MTTLPNLSYFVKWLTQKSSVIMCSTIKRHNFLFYHTCNSVSKQLLYRNQAPLHWGPEQQNSYRHYADIILLPFVSLHNVQILLCSIQKYIWWLKMCPLRSKAESPLVHCVLLFIFYKRNISPHNFCLTCRVFSWNYNTIQFSYLCHLDSPENKTYYFCMG